MAARTKAKSSRWCFMKPDSSTRTKTSRQVRKGADGLSRRRRNRLKAYFLTAQRIVRPLLLLKVGCQDLCGIREHKQDFTPVRCHYYVAQCALRATGRQCVGLRQRACAVGPNRVGACEGSAAAKPGDIVDVTPGQITASIKCDY